ncbi:MAG: hypothetical protein RSF39_09055 [Romboutsia sp.]
MHVIGGITIKSKVVLCLLVAVSIMIIGCSNKSNDKIDEVKNPNTSINEQITNDKYKEILVKNYEKYLKPIDLNLYDDIDNISKNTTKDNRNEIINKLKADLSDAKTNIRAFETNMSSIEVEDKILNDLNIKLKDESYKLIDDITERENRLNSLDEAYLSGSDEKFPDYLEKILETRPNNLDNNRFEDTLEEIENVLRIDLDRD